MEWLNYHHLLYFWMVAREGSIAGACEQLHLAQPTISSQLRQLEKSLGTKLFRREGRRLVLTEQGQNVYRYADEIFSLGREMVDSVRGRLAGYPLRLTVGRPDVLPKLIMYRLLRPALKMPEPVQLVAYEGKLDQLLAELSKHQYDVVLSDSPVPPMMHIKAYNHLLGECGVTLFATPDLARRYKPSFPKSLEGAPLLVPTPNTSLRRALDQWLDGHDLRPRIVGEVEDSALLKVFGQVGEGIFPAPSAIEKEVCKQYSVRVVGHIAEVRERFYAISVERKLKHPAVVAISTAAREELFSSEG
jgi:LysR family transcriptional regulator, transcriptional activator of nhaA